MRVHDDQPERLRAGCAQPARQHTLHMLALQFNDAVFERAAHLGLS